jgi:cytochrome c oxidase cbb3-type subunit III
MLLVVSTLVSQQQKATPAGKAAQPKGPARSATNGKEIFETRCAGCHGLDGRGGERAPDIATTAKSQRRTDQKLAEIIQTGVPETGMPAFDMLGPNGIVDTVSYLRELQGRTGASAPPGDAAKGRTVFFGKGRCAECHMVAGSGGFIAGDLTAWGVTRSVDDIRNAITKPSTVSRRGVKMAVTTREGQRYAGVIRNEDNFSIQLQTLDGEFHLFLKAELQSFARAPDSLMPTDYASTLSATELNDLVSFLMKTARDGKTAATPSGKAASDFEEE